MVKSASGQRGGRVGADARRGGRGETQWASRCRSPLLLLWVVYSRAQVMSLTVGEAMRRRTGSAPWLPSTPDFTDVAFITVASWLVLFASVSKLR